MMLFKRSFGLTRSLFILYVQEHDRLGHGMLTVETAAIHLFILIVPIATEKVSRIQSNIRDLKIHYGYFGLRETGHFPVVESEVGPTAVK